MPNIIYNEDRYFQRIRFTEMSHGRAFPTGVDFELEYRGLLYITAQYKFHEAKIERGTRRLMKWKIDTIESSIRPKGGYAFALVVSHTTMPGKDINAKDGVIKEIYTQGRWINGPVTSGPPADAWEAGNIPEIISRPADFMAFFCKKIDRINKPKEK